MFRRRKPPDAASNNIYATLRGGVLRAAEQGALAPKPAHPRVLGIVVDVPAQGGYATVVALSEPAGYAVSMYTSTGGGTIGAGAHAPVATAAHDLLAEADEHLDAFVTADDYSLPPAGSVRLHAQTTAGALSTDVPEAAFWGREPHVLTPVIAALQNLVTAIRTSTPD